MKEKWITAKDLMKEWDILEFELFDLFKKGLRPYSRNTGVPIPCPKENHMGCKRSVALSVIKPGLYKEIQEDFKTYCSWKFLDLLSLEQNLAKLPLDLDTTIFQKKDVQELAKKIGFEEKRDEKQSLLPCKPTTRWEDIKITLIDDMVVEIKTPDGVRKFSYHEIGMADNRTRDKRPSTLWALLTIFAKYQGYISPTNVEYDSALPDTAKRLNKHLQNLFNIHEPIFTDHYKAEKGYRTKIFFSDQTQVIQ